MLFAEIPQVWQLEAIVDSLDWHRRHELSNPSTVLNACRSWLYVDTERCASKRDAAAWVRTRGPEWKVAIDAALGAFDRGLELRSDIPVGRLVAWVTDTASKKLSASI